jgi:AhpD family alkylhydroperoxidase
MNMKENLKAVNSTLKKLGEANPEAMRSFKKYMGATKEEGALSHKMKELMGVALSVVKQCEFCVALHVHNSLEAGATREEIIESAATAGMMGGGPAIMFIKYVFDALDEFQ